MRTLSLLSAAAIAAACQSPTQIVVWVDSDFEVPGELAAVQAVVRDTSDAVVGTDFFSLSQHSLPLSFGIEGGALSGEQVRVVLQGLTARDELLVERTAVVGFVAGEKRLLPMFLARSCGATSCPQGQTCTERGCISSSVDVRSLPVVEPGDEILHDAGVHRDAGPPPADTGVDSGADAGADSGLDGAVDPEDGGPQDIGFRDGGFDGGLDAGGLDAMIRDAGPIGVPCVREEDCGGNATCVDSFGEPCGAAGTRCSCNQRCDPFAPGSFCAPDQACYLRDDPSLGGVCLHRDTSTAANFRAPCTVATDCDRYENWICRNFGDNQPSECTSLCQDSNFCQARVPNTICDTNPFVSPGLCLEPSPPYQDLTRSCVGDTECQSGRCLRGFGPGGPTNTGFCSATCNGLQACPQGALCAFSLNGESWCLPWCFTDAECTNNPSFVCRQDIGVPLCFFRCDNVNYPCQAGQTCDPTGHCI